MHFNVLYIYSLQIFFHILYVTASACVCASGSVWVCACVRACVQLGILCVCVCGLEVMSDIVLNCPLPYALKTGL